MWLISGIATGFLGGVFIAIIRAPAEDRPLVLVLTILTGILIVAGLVLVLGAE